MILSAAEIVRRIELGDARERLVIRPYSSACQQPASYDLRAAEEIRVPVGSCSLLPTMEWVELPPDLAGTIRCRSSFGRRGVLLGAGFVDPGFRGQLTLCLSNLGNAEVTIGNGERVAQMILHEIRNPAGMYD